MTPRIMLVVLAVVLTCRVSLVFADDTASTVADFLLDDELPPDPTADRDKLRSTTKTKGRPKRDPEAAYTKDWCGTRPDQHGCHQRLDDPPRLTPGVLDPDPTRPLIR